MAQVPKERIESEESDIACTHHTVLHQFRTRSKQVPFTCKPGARTVLQRLDLFARDVNLVIGEILVHVQHVVLGGWWVHGSCTHGDACDAIGRVGVTSVASRGAGSEPSTPLSSTFSEERSAARD